MFVALFFPPCYLDSFTGLCAQFLPAAMGCRKASLHLFRIPPVTPGAAVLFVVCVGHLLVEAAKALGVVVAGLDVPTPCMLAGDVCTPLDGLLAPIAWDKAHIPVKAGQEPVV